MLTASEVWKTVSYRPFLREMFAGFIRLLLRRQFSGFTMIGQPPLLDHKRPWIFIANHISWWDGFFLWSLQRKLAPARRIYTVMLAREYLKQRWFRWVGALPLEPGSSSSLRYLLRFVEGLLQSSEKPWILSFFPQGEIRPMATRPLQLHRGWQGLLRRVPEALVIPVALHIEPGHERLPKVWLHVGPAFSLPQEPHTEMTAKDLAQLLEQGLDEIFSQLSVEPREKEMPLASTSLF